MYGNVQALMVAGIVWGLQRPSGPVWVALAASLKVAPILFALHYLRRREWRKLGLTLGLTAALWIPMLAFNWTDYPGKPEAIPPILIPVALGLWWWRPALLGVVVLAAYPAGHPSYVSYLVPIPQSHHAAWK
jgi:hypothetical protein